MEGAMRDSGVGLSHLFWAIGGVAAAVVLLTWAPWSAKAAGPSTDSPRASNVAMSCAPGQQALVHQAVVNGELRVNVACGNQTSAMAAGFTDDDLARPVAYDGQAVGMVPAVYRTAPIPISAPPRVAVRQQRVVRHGARAHDWRKDALVIGGSAGAGAGIGGLIGGKKGALIGAALGGGSAALYRVAGR